MIIKEGLHRLYLSSSGGGSYVLNVQTRSASKFRCFSSHGPPERAMPHDSVGSLDAPATRPSGADKIVPASFGKQRRRRGLPAIDRTSTQDQSSRSAGGPLGGSPRTADRSPRQQESKNGSLPLSGNTRQEPMAMPSHLSASIGRSPPRQHGSVFGPRVGVSQQKEDENGGRPTSGADDRHRSQQGASTSAADVSDIGDRAEGILQIGASGAQIPLYGRDVESILKAVNLDKQRLDSYSEAMPDDMDEMLEVTFDQLPKGFIRRDFDWSGQTNYTGMQRKVQEERRQWQASKVSGSTEKIEMTLDGEPVAVLPLWVAVYQEVENGLARLHESTFPLSVDLVDELECDLQPFCAVAGLRFQECDERYGPWRNYYVGIVGDVDSDEDDVLWPNQAIHGNRTIYNVRNGWDIARFLADAVKEDVESHLGNLKRLQEERRYKSGWAYHVLRSRWGDPVLRNFDVRVDT
ncbi:g7911 [Coccomyxa elongata]